MRAVKWQRGETEAANGQQEEAASVEVRYLFPSDQILTIASDGSVEVLRVLRSTKDIVTLVLAGRMGVP